MSAVLAGDNRAFRTPPARLASVPVSSSAFAARPPQCLWRMHARTVRSGRSYAPGLWSAYVTIPRRMTTTLQRYQRIAPLYDLLDLPFEYGRYRRIRPLLFTGLTGRILDAGVGTGRNAPFYPHGSSIVGIDLSPAMLARA